MSIITLLLCPSTLIMEVTCFANQFHTSLETNLLRLLIWFWHSLMKLVLLPIFWCPGIILGCILLENHHLMDHIKDSSEMTSLMVIDEIYTHSPEFLVDPELFSIDHSGNIDNYNSLYNFLWNITIKQAKSILTSLLVSTSSFLPIFFQEK